MVETQPWSEDLHQRVLTYQNELVNAREENVRKRAEEPEMAAGVCCVLFDIGGRYTDVDALLLPIERRCRRLSLRIKREYGCSSWPVWPSRPSESLYHQ
jgi:hypothetical protein